jgi:undecaprenyl-diphosphatase
MNIIQAIILGIIQGITEFLPISSSAHLVIFPYLFGWNFPTDQNFTFDVIVQLGTLISLIIYFRKDLWKILKVVLNETIHRDFMRTEDSRLGWYILIATIPAGLAGLLLKSKVEAAFNNPAITSFFLLGTAFLLIIAEVISKKSRTLADLTWKNAIVFGLFQAISIFPGISRSGACLSGGMIQNFNRKDAARFSFLMAIPIMFAAGLIGFIDLFKINNLIQFLPAVIIGSFTAAIMGYFVISWMLSFLNNHSLYLFAIYCILLSVLVLGLNLISPSKAVAATSQKNGETVIIHYPSSLSWIIPTINECNQNSLNQTIIYNHRTDTSTEMRTIRIGEKKLGSGEMNSFLIQQDYLRVVVNKSNPLIQLDINQLQEIYKGNLTSWQDVISKCPQCINNNEASSTSMKTIQTWIFIPGSTSQNTINQFFLNNLPTSLSANIAPDEQAMSEAVSVNPAAIGFLFNHWINDQLKVLPITGLSETFAKYPILVSVNPSDAQKFEPLLLCVQRSIST